MVHFFSGLLLSFLMIFVAIVKYWYVSVPIIAIIVACYIKTKNNIVKKILRIIIALIAIALIIGFILFIFGR